MAAFHDEVANGEERALVLAAQRGCRRTFGQLLKRHERAVFAFVLRTEGCNQDLAADIVQDTFEIACRRLQRFRGQSLFRTWLFGIAANRIRSLRRRQRLQRLLRLENLTEVHPGNTQSFPGDTLQQSQQRAHIERAFAGLSRVQREALYMREFEDLSHEEIAVALNLNRNTVKSRIHSARQAMLRELEDVKSVLIGPVPEEESWHDQAG